MFWNMLFPMREGLTSDFSLQWLLHCQQLRASHMVFLWLLEHKTTKTWCGGERGVVGFCSMEQFFLWYFSNLNLKMLTYINKFLIAIFVLNLTYEEVVSVWYWLSAQYRSIVASGDFFFAILLYLPNCFCPIMLFRTPQCHHNYVRLRWTGLIWTSATFAMTYKSCDWGKRNIITNRNK